MTLFSALFIIVYNHLGLDFCEGAYDPGATICAPSTSADLGVSSLEEWARKNYMNIVDGTRLNRLDLPTLAGIGQRTCEEDAKRVRA
eukprot:189671-Prorocentrum_minimum.AAC.1